MYDGGQHVLDRKEGRHGLVRSGKWEGGECLGECLGWGLGFQVGFRWLGVGVGCGGTGSVRVVPPE